MNPSKFTKNKNRHYSPIVHVCMNTRKVGANFENFLILFYSGCSSTILMINLISKLKIKEDAVIKCHTQAVNINTNRKVELDFTLPEISATKIMTWNCHVYDSAKGGYDIILGRYILT